MHVWQQLITNVFFTQVQWTPVHQKYDCNILSGIGLRYLSTDSVYDYPNLLDTANKFTIGRQYKHFTNLMFLYTIGIRMA